MATDAATKNAAVDGAGNLLETRWYAIHNGATSGDQVSNERLQPVYDPAAAASADLNATLAFTGTGSQAVSHLGVWDASTAGTFLFAVALTGDLAFNAAGDINLTSAAITVADV